MKRLMKLDTNWGAKAQKVSDEIEKTGHVRFFISRRGAIRIDDASAPLKRGEISILFECSRVRSGALQRTSDKQFAKIASAFRFISSVMG